MLSRNCNCKFAWLIASPLRWNDLSDEVKAGCVHELFIAAALRRSIEVLLMRPFCTWCIPLRPPCQDSSTWRARIPSFDDLQPHLGLVRHTHKLELDPWLPLVIIIPKLLVRCKPTSRQAYVDAPWISTLQLDVVSLHQRLISNIELTGIHQPSSAIGRIPPFDQSVTLSFINKPQRFVAD